MFDHADASSLMICISITLPSQTFRVCFSIYALPKRKFPLVIPGRASEAQRGEGNPGGVGGTLSKVKHCTSPVSDSPPPFHRGLDFGGKIDLR
jgi:hypothetical protein